jgi:hypothetical protein
VEAVQIPASVQGIGIGAFEGCLRLVHVSVEENNAAFFAEDGVLYSRDGTTLLVYPMGKRCPAVTVPLSVRYIASGAFLECPSLLCVCYEGSVDDWQRIEIAPGNHCLFTLPMRFETQARKK